MTAATPLRSHAVDAGRSGWPLVTVRAMLAVRLIHQCQAGPRLQLGAVRSRTHAQRRRTARAAAARIDRHGRPRRACGHRADADRRAVCERTADHVTVGAPTAPCRSEQQCAHCRRCCLALDEPNWLIRASSAISMLSLSPPGRNLSTPSPRAARPAAGSGGLAAPAYGGTDERGDHVPARIQDPYAAGVRRARSVVASLIHLRGSCNDF